MPYRFEPCVTGEIYHIFNRSVGKNPIFSDSAYCHRFLELLSYYRFERPSHKFSVYNRLPFAAKQEYLVRLQSQPTLIDILIYCLMPNHFHLIVRQKRDNGIREFATRLQNGYAKYFNVKTNRYGAVFQAMFKSVRIETDEQIQHVARYIHLNPHTATLTSLSELESYPWSSLQEYTGKRKTDWLETATLSALYKTTEALKKFTYDQADYQRLLFIESHLYHE